MKPAGSNQRMSAQRGEARRGADSSFRATQCGGMTVAMGAKTMRSGNDVKPNKTVKPSVTDQILHFCASGRFGVREAIAAATTPKRPKKSPSRQEEDVRRTG